MIYDRARDAIERAFTRNGTACQLHRTTSATVDKITGVRTASAPTIVNTLGFLGARKVRAEDGTLRVEAIAKLRYGNPQIGDKLVLGKTYTITSVEERNPDGGAVMVYIVGLS